MVVKRQSSKKTSSKKTVTKVQKPAIKETHTSSNIFHINLSFKKFRILQTMFSKNWLTFLVVVGSIVATQATLIWSPKIGIYINAGALMILVALALIKADARKLAISTAIIPVSTIIVASFMPSNVFGKIVVFYDAVLLLALLYRFIFTLEEPVKVTRLTARGYAFTLPLMAVIGEILGVISYLFLRHHYPYYGYSLPLVAVVSVVMAFAEEMLLRGLIQQQASKIFHPALAALSTTILYVFLGLSHVTMLTLPVAILIGAVLSITYYYKQNLILTTTINAVAKLAYLGLVASFILRY